MLPQVFQRTTQGTLAYIFFVFLDILPFGMADLAFRLFIATMPARVEIPGISAKQRRLAAHSSPRATWQ